jgi:hypothetical protein
VRFRRVINKAFKRAGEGSAAAGGVNAVVSANVNERGRSVTRVSSSQRIVQRSGRNKAGDRRAKQGKTRKEE